jgi:two-component system OmpR family sensor kinase
MNSLRAHLVMMMLPLYLLTAAGALLISYLQYDGSINAFMDGQIYNLMLSSSRGGAGTAAPPPIRILDEEHVEHFGTPIVQLWSKDLRLVASSWPIPGVEFQAVDGFHDATVNGHGWRLYTAHSPAGNLQIVQSTEFRHRVILHSAEKSAAPILLLLPFSVALLWLAVHLALRPVGRLVQTVTHQDEHTLTPLTIESVPRELVPLVAAVNGLLARLRLAFSSEQRFVQDAAHALRTPLMALMLQAENLRGRLGTTASGEIARLEGGIGRLHRVVEQLLALAREQGQSPGAPCATVELLPLLQEVVAELMPLAEQRGIDVGFGRVEPLTVYADARTLRLIFDNLLENALHHSPAGASVDVGLYLDADAVRIEFTDSGRGIAPELLVRVFDRFFRPACTTAPGTGLGLAIAHAAAQRSGAQIKLNNRSEGSGLRASVELPAQ